MEVVLFLLIVSPLKYFEIAGADGVYHDAQAVILNNTIHVTSGLVPTPIKVRYAWHTNPENPNFANQEGLMATPISYKCSILE